MNDQQYTTLLSAITALSQRFDAIDQKLNDITGRIEIQTREAAQTEAQILGAIPKQ